MRLAPFQCWQNAGRNSSGRRFRLLLAILGTKKGPPANRRAFRLGSLQDGKRGPVCAGRPPQGRKPMEIHGTAATTASAISSTSM